MSSVLESVEWGKTALTLIEQMKRLDSNIPAVMHIRHSERYPVNTKQSTYGLALTELGEKASYEFGEYLPKNRKYHHFHTIVDRTRDTAINIHKGIVENNGKSTGLIPIEVKSVVDLEANSSYMRKVFKECEDELTAVKKIFYRWLSGYFPPTVRKPSLMFAQEIASLMMEKVGEAGPDDMLVWVTHDNFIAAFIHHWFGEYLVDWIEFLDGFILQFYDNHMVLYFGREKKKVEYPYWWNF